MAPKKYKQKQKHMPAKSQPTKSAKKKSNKSLFIAVAVVALIIVVFGALALSGQLSQTPGQTTIEPTKVLLQTTAGNITIDLRTDKPITSTNFINLVRDGKYDGTNFSRTIPTFMIQGGKITGSTPTINDEIGTNNHNIKYSVAMAKTNQPNSATSEFFINTADNTNANFDATYTVFGTVIAGQDVVNAIANAPAHLNPNMPNQEISEPDNPVTILHATIVS